MDPKHAPIEPTNQNKEIKIDTNQMLIEIRNAESMEANIEPTNQNKEIKIDTNQMLTEIKNAGSKEANNETEEGLDPLLKVLCVMGLPMTIGLVFVLTYVIKKNGFSFAHIFVMVAILWSFYSWIELLLSVPVVKKMSNKRKLVWGIIVVIASLIMITSVVLLVLFV